MKRTYKLIASRGNEIVFDDRIQSDTPRNARNELKKLLGLHAKKVLTTDPFVTGDPNLLPLQEVIRGSDILILCTPHSDYARADLRGRKVYDIWSFFQS